MFQVGSRDNQIVQALNSFKGPFSLIFYDKDTNNLYFSRDRIGRSTMLFLKNDNSIVISSVLGKLIGFTAIIYFKISIILLSIFIYILGKTYDCIEVPATHIFCLDLDEKKIITLPRDSKQEIAVTSFENWLENLQLQQSLPDEEFSFDFDETVDYHDHVGHNILSNYMQYLCIQYFN